ncbi:MAG TPA: CpsB/CapC family capsule biosynthesis tyrosine phosphatase [Gemmatimonadaceae bacterium]|nr:CpsB/CapC family capsule biosynthesis tyrosine phosphatase [Gemmatimonadaceae bacterium]
MIDLHSHLLPGVDDGSPSVERSAPVLKRFADQGVECVVLTPHLTASRVAQAPHARHAELLQALRAAVPDGPELRLGWEIMLDEPNVDLRARELALGESTAVLVEFPRVAVPARAGAELSRIRGSGLVPVLAHPERYWGCTPEKVVEWRAAGAVIQMDVASLAGRGTIAATARALLADGLVDLFSSDNHGDSRALASARDWLLQHGTPTHAELMTETNARRLLADEPVLPVPPLRRIGGVLSRLGGILRR